MIIHNLQYIKKMRHMQWIIDITLYGIEVCGDTPHTCAPLTRWCSGAEKPPSHLWRHTTYMCAIHQVVQRGGEASQSFVETHHIHVRYSPGGAAGRRSLPVICGDTPHTCALFTRWCSGAEKPSSHLWRHTTYICATHQVGQRFLPPGSCPSLQGYYKVLVSLVTM